MSKFSRTQAMAARPIASQRSGSESSPVQARASARWSLGSMAIVPIARLFFAPGSAALRDYAAEPLLCVSLEEKQDRVAEMFDRYNLLALPVIDRDQHVIGVITVDDIVALLRQ